MEEYKDSYKYQLMSGKRPHSAKAEVIATTRNDAQGEEVQRYLEELDRSDHQIGTYIDFYDSILLKTGDSTCYYPLHNKTKTFRKFSEHTMATLFPNKGVRAKVVTSLLQIVELGYSRFNPALHYIEDGRYKKLNLYTFPTWYSNYLASEVRTPLELLQLYRDFFMHLTGGNEESFEYLLDWMAYSLRSDVTNRCYLVLMAIEGLGKGVFGHLLRELNGADNYVELMFKDMRGTFNGFLSKRTTVVIDEVMVRTIDDEDILKPLANDSFMCEEKFAPKFSVKNQASYVLLTNHDNALRISPKSRRYSVIDTGDKMLGELTWKKYECDEDHFENNLLLKPENVAQLGAYLLQRKVTRNMKKPFFGVKSSQAVASAAADWEQAFISEVCAQYAGQTITVKAAIGYLKDHVAFETRITNKTLDTLSKKFPGIFTVKKRATPDERNLRPISCIIEPLESQAKYDGINK